MDRVHLVNHDWDACFPNGSLDGMLYAVRGPQPGIFLTLAEAEAVASAHPVSRVKEFLTGRDASRWIQGLLPTAAEQLGKISRKDRRVASDMIGTMHDKLDAQDDPSERNYPVAFRLAMRQREGRQRAQKTPRIPPDVGAQRIEGEASARHMVV